MLLSQIHKISHSGNQFPEVVDWVMDAFTDLYHAQSISLYLFNEKGDRLKRQKTILNKKSQKEVEKFTGIKS